MLEPFSVVHKYYAFPFILNWMMRSSRILGMKPNFPNNKFSQEKERETTWEFYWRIQCMIQERKKNPHLESEILIGFIDKVNWAWTLFLQLNWKEKICQIFQFYTHQVPISSQKNKEGKRRKILSTSQTEAK